MFVKFLIGTFTMSDSEVAAFAVLECSGLLLKEMLQIVSVESMFSYIFLFRLPL